jgi:6-phosphogluconolactonase/glucosamine-6-phosphate isomerase/deaminase
VLSNIRFVKTDQSAAAAGFLSHQIQLRLDDSKKVIWFVSGGSALEVAALVAKKLKGPLSSLTVALVDERYGPTGHSSSNWQQLMDMGFDLDSAQLEPILNNHSLAETTSNYNLLMEKLFAHSAYKIALLGLGTDGHTAGILPGSPAVDSKELVVHYSTPEFERITLTSRALTCLDEAVVYVQGPTKYRALNDLAKDLLLRDQPAQILKQIPKVIIFNDLKGDKHEISD